MMTHIIWPRIDMMTHIIWPRIGPWSTPGSTYLKFHNRPFMTTLFFLFVKWLRTKFSKFQFEDEAFVPNSVTRFKCIKKENMQTFLFLFTDSPWSLVLWNHKSAKCLSQESLHWLSNDLTNIINNYPAIHFFVSIHSRCVGCPSTCLYHGHHQQKKLSFFPCFF